MNRLLLIALQVSTLVFLLLVFFVSLELMSSAFKHMGSGVAETLLSRTRNPFLGLLVGILGTTLVQSSSATTSMVVSMVAGGALSIEGAIPIAMGANIGTSVTNTLVSLSQISRPEEFRRAFAGATIHDFFNWLTVVVLLPLEIAFGMLATMSRKLAALLEGVGGTELLSPVKMVTKPASAWISGLLGDNGIVILIFSLLLLFFALRFLVDLLKTVMSSGVERALHATLFRSPPYAIGAGAAVTAAVQSSSITTSTMVPLVGAGVVTLEQVFPFTVGANLGTTIPAMLAALQVGSRAAITVAFSHLLFNMAGMLLIYAPPPTRRMTLGMARWIADLAVRRRGLAVFLVLGMFYLVPLGLLFVSGALREQPALVESTVPTTEDGEGNLED